MIKLTNLFKSYNGKTILSDFSVTFEKGISFLIGENGKGKTTILKIIMGVEKPDKGGVEIEDESISVMFQENRLLEKLDIKSNIEYVTDKEIPQSLLLRLELNEHIHTPVMKLSGGTKRRVALARALCYDFKILLLDEPFTGMDEAIKQKAMDAIIEFSKGKTVIISTHDKYAIEYMIDFGKIIEVK